MLDYYTSLIDYIDNATQFAYQLFLVLLVEKLADLKLLLPAAQYQPQGMTTIGGRLDYQAGPEQLGPPGKLGLVVAFFDQDVIVVETDHLPAVALVSHPVHQSYQGYDLQTGKGQDQPQPGQREAKGYQHGNDRNTPDEDLGGKPLGRQIRADHDMALHFPAIKIAFYHRLPC